MKQDFGDEYPRAVTTFGVRMTLSRQTRWTRFYKTEDGRQGFLISRFMDGSSSVTLHEVQQCWCTWSPRERDDFCQAAPWLHGQPDFPEILRFIMKAGDCEEWSYIVLSLAHELPQDEAFDMLVDALDATMIGRRANLIQALAATKHREGEPTLRKQLGEIWEHPELGAKDDFTNWVAFDATVCIEHLLQLGADPNEFVEQVRVLSRHACSGNRDTCRRYLKKYYSWLSMETEQGHAFDAQKDARK